MSPSNVPRTEQFLTEGADGDVQSSEGPELSPELSVVVPARNEELVLAATLASIQRAISASHVSAEIIVVDDASTDRTAEIASEQGAQVVPVAIHIIAGVRNAGAKRARGKYLLFLDADTLLPEKTLAAILRELRQGTVGGGARVTFDAYRGLVTRLLVALFTWYWIRLRGWATGCCVYCTRQAFEQIGGFNENYYAAEEMVISKALQGVGKFVIVQEPVITSARKIRLFSLWKLLRIAVPVLLGGEKRFLRREGLEILYDAPRESAESPGSKNPG